MLSALFELEEKKVAFLEIVWNLVEEEEKVSRAIEEIEPEAILLDIGEEDLEFLYQHEKDQIPVELSYVDLSYIKKLSRYGEVSQPSPHLTKLIEVARSKGIPVKAIDLDDDGYLEAFYRDVTARELFMRALQLRWMRAKKFNEPDPHEFSLRWNEALSNARGYNNLMSERISYMAERIRRDEGSLVLFVSDPFIGERVRRLLK